MAPKTAMPRALPIERANMLVPVTTPRSAQSTADCAAIRVGLATQPRPSPTTKQVTATGQTELSGRDRPAAQRRPRITAEPISAVSRKPIRR